MARVRVDPEAVQGAVADYFRPGGSAEPLSPNRDYAGHQHFNLSQGLDFAQNTIYPMAGKVGKLLAGVGNNIGNAVSDAQGAEQAQRAGPDLTALRAKAADAIRQRYAADRQTAPTETGWRAGESDPRMAQAQQQSPMSTFNAAGHAGLKRGQELQDAGEWQKKYGKPYAGPPEPMPLAQPMSDHQANYARNMGPVSPEERDRRLRAEANSRSIVQIPHLETGPHTEPMHPDVQAVHDRMFDPNRPHIADDDLKRYTELRKELQKATNAGKSRAELDRILHELDVQRERITSGPAAQPSAPAQGADRSRAELVSPPTLQSPNGTPDAAATAAYRAQPQVAMVKTPKGEMPATRIDQNRVMLHDPSTGEFVIVTRNPDGSKRTQLLTGAQADQLLSADERSQYRNDQPAQAPASPVASPVAPVAAPTQPTAQPDAGLSQRKAEIEQQIDALYRQKGRMSPEQMSQFNDLREELDALTQEPTAATQAPQPAAPVNAAPEPAAQPTSQPAAPVVAPVAEPAAKTEAPAEEAPATDLNARLMQLAAKARAGTMTAEDHRESQLLMQHYNAMHPEPEIAAPPQRMNQEQMILAAAAADTPEKKAALAKQIGNAGVYSDDLFDLLTGSHDARSKFAQHLVAAMPHAQPHQAQTPEQAAHLRAQAAQSQAMADYYKNAKTPDVAADNTRAAAADAEKVRANKAREKLAEAKRIDAAAKAKAADDIARSKLDQNILKLDENARQFNANPNKHHLARGVNITVGDNVKALKLADDSAEDALRNVEATKKPAREVVLKNGGVGTLSSDEFNDRFPGADAAGDAPALVVPANASGRVRDDAKKAHDAEMKAWREERAKAEKARVEALRDRGDYLHAKAMLDDPLLKEAEDKALGLKEQIRERAMGMTKRKKK